MADPYLTDLQPGDTRDVRRVVIQRWMKNVATNFAARYATGTPLTGGYRIDLRPLDDNPTMNCAEAAWARNISDQT